MNLPRATAIVLAAVTLTATLPARAVDVARPDGAAQAGRVAADLRTAAPQAEAPADEPPVRPLGLAASLVASLVALGFLNVRQRMV